MFSKISGIYREFPSRFWTVVGVMFIDKVGRTILFPFFSLYITEKFGVGMAQAGIILGFFSFFGIEFTGISEMMYDGTKPISGSVA